MTSEVLQYGSVIGFNEPSEDFIAELRRKFIERVGTGLIVEPITIKSFVVDGREVWGWYCRYAPMDFKVPDTLEGELA